VTVSADTQVTDLSADDHACLTFGEREELLDLTAAFARDGLAAGLRVVLADDSPALAVARLDGRGVPAGPAAAAGQLIVAGWEDALAGPGGFSAGQAMGWLRGMLAGARRDGWPGLRVAVDMGWALRPVTGVEELPGFEEQIGAAAAGGAGLSVLCGYDRERFDAVTLASVAPWHSRSVAAATYHADPVLRICRQYVPPGVRLAGELDYQAREPLAAALAEALRLDGDITVNMAALSLIDAACTRMILDAARSLPPGRVMVLRCARPAGDRFARFGAAGLPQVRMAVADDER
jgi:hypothetical protein